MFEEQAQQIAMFQAQHAVLLALMVFHPDPIALSSHIEHYAESARIVFREDRLSETAMAVFETEVKAFRDFCLQLAPASRA